MTREENTKAMLFIGCSVVLSAGAQLLMKVSMNELHGVDIATALQNLVALAPVMVWAALGLTSYALSLAFWLKALSRCELSLAYPMLSLSYVLVYITAVYWPRLGETASPLKTLGTIVIVAGVILVTRVPKQKSETQAAEP